MRYATVLTLGLVGLLGCNKPQLYGRITELTRADHSYTIRFSAGGCAIRAGDTTNITQEYDQLVFAAEAQQLVGVPDKAIGEKQGQCYTITAPPQ